MKSPLTELKELSSSLTTEEMMAEIKELKAECSGYRARVEKIKSATNHVTPEEKEKVGNTFILLIATKHLRHLVTTLFLSCQTAWWYNAHDILILQVYKERNVYVKEWKKRKRLVIYI